MIFLFAIIGSYVVYHLPMKADVEIKRIDLNKYKKVMFVAHPDDDMIWGANCLWQKFDYSKVGFLTNIDFLGLITHIRELQSSTNRKSDLEIAIQIGNHTIGSTYFKD